jgi:DNA (cytosine-5)-methyltransferase 1
MQLTLDLTQISKYRIIDLFAGIGGIRIGFEQAFGENQTFVFASEINTFAQKTYATHFGEHPFGDITKIDESKIPNFDILLAGFPCQPFSNAGLKKGFEDSRGTLFFDIARIVKYHKPQVIFLENVKAFKNHDNGNTYKVVEMTLQDLGYSVYSQILNAKDFGVPQNRERIYIIAFLGDVDFTFPIPPKHIVKLGDVLENNIDKKYTISDRLWEGHQRRKIEHKEKGNGFGYSLFDENSEYTSTISARYYKDGSEILIAQTNDNPRKITPREAARLQGFPEEFAIVVSDTQAYRQFGNSVSVPVIRAIAKSIYNALLKAQINDN